MNTLWRRRHGLMLRYRHADDFGATTSAFSVCSFWWVEALAMMGELDAAIAFFQSLPRLRAEFGSARPCSPAPPPHAAGS